MVRRNMMSIIALFHKQRSEEQGRIEHYVYLLLFRRLRGKTQRVCGFS